MKIPAKFKEYIWLVNTIRKARRITFAEINEKGLQTDMSEGIELARSTFARHKDAIEDIFGIYIDCDRQNGYEYYIGNDYVLREDSVQNWMLSTLSVSNVISESMSLQNRILLQEVPYEGEYLKMVIEAMKKSVRIAVDYRKYGTDKPNHLVFEPYCIKLFRRRWYLLGRFESSGFITLSFDRMLEISVTEETFKMDRKFDAQTYFGDYFGVMTDDRLPIEHIVLRAYGNEPYYLRDLPLHPTQREVATGEDYTDFEVCLHPTRDFLAYILSRGGWVQVISPENIVLEIKQMLNAAEENYK